MSFLTPNVFYWGEQPYPSGGTTAAADPQLQFFENFPGHLGFDFYARSQATLSVHGVNIPLSISFNKPSILVNFTLAAGNTVSRSLSYSFGLYSMNNGTLSLANSASRQETLTANAATSYTSWLSMVTSATQNISPGAWYFAMNISTAGGASGQNFIMGNSSNGFTPTLSAVFIYGRMTASTGAMPASIATSDLDKGGSDAVRQPYIIITT